MGNEGLKVFERGEFPRWVRIKQNLDEQELDDAALVAAIRAELAKPEIAATITPGAKVAITAGSRGIDRIAMVIRTIVDGVRALGGQPFIVPAMGSHGGATVAGQLGILEHYGITPGAMGCEIRASMETVLLGHVLDNVPVYFDRTAYEQADIVIPVGRVKPHTAFRGPVESGLMKMLAIGLGKQKGADYFHQRGFVHFHELIPAVGRFTLTQVPIPFGIALVENGHSRQCLVEAIPAATMWEREQDLLQIAAAKLPTIPGERVDVLILDYIGKDISGDGADPNVIKKDTTGFHARMAEKPKPHVNRVIIRDLTSDTEGNACGIGLADFALRRAVEKVDPVKTYMNLITAKFPDGGKLPLACDSDKQALHFAISSSLNLESEQAAIVRIESTKHVEELWVSEPMLAQIAGDARWTVIGDLHDIPFDAAGMFAE
jgi:hypothetical protein